MVSTVDGACGLRGLGSGGLPSTAEDDDDDSDPPRQSFTVLTIIQLVALLSFVVAWAYGLFVVLNLFSRQHHALPGAELCDRHLYDPIFIIAVIVGLVLFLIPLALLCTCLTSQLCLEGGVTSASSEGRRKKYDDLEPGVGGGGSVDEEHKGLLGADEALAPGGLSSGPQISSETATASGTVPMGSAALQRQQNPWGSSAARGSGSGSEKGGELAADVFDIADATSPHLLSAADVGALNAASGGEPSTGISATHAGT